MINSQPLIDKICNKINQGSLTDLETCQTTNALAILSNPIVSVANKNSLPSVIEYADRMIYVVEENRYYYSNGYFWSSDLSSQKSVIVSQAWSWGSGTSGTLGDGTIVSKSSPVSVVGGIVNWCQISSFTYSTIGLRADGTAWAWGANTGGQLGDGTTTNRSSPVSVVGAFTDWCQVSAGNGHHAGIRTNGTLWTWGCNSCGQLGSGTTANRSSPGSVVGGFTDWCQVSANPTFTLGIRLDGTLWSWGYNNCGQLGDGTITTKLSPVSVVGGFTDWRQIKGGNNHSLGLKADGTIWSWGNNNRGELGDGTLTAKSSPVSVVGGFTDWCQISAAGRTGLGIRTNGTLWIWGYNSRGQAGTGDCNVRSSPASVLGGITNWCQASAAANHTFAIRADGSLWSWGLNDCGQLGDGTTLGRTSPGLVAGGFTDWFQIAGNSRGAVSIRNITKGF